MPFHIAAERVREFLNACALEGRIQYQSLDILFDGQRAVNVRFDIIVEPRIK